eukprot:Lithocolla_globosa_v1_NODE_3572_length_1634_cov_15.932869.p1 type:complete len:453 gc:universal NODE_3572_length_1634_cov_15.932869:1362-4(-)
MGGGVNNSLSVKAISEYSGKQYFKDHRCISLLNLVAPISQDESKRAPIDIVCVIDVSGSMAGQKLNLIKKTMKFLVDQLDSNDQLGIVCYDTHVVTTCSLQKMDADAKQKTKKKVDDIKAGSCTNLSGGLLRGLDLAGGENRVNEICSVLLFTDGLANKGITKTETLVQATEKKVAEMKKKASVFTFGFGSDHEPDMLRPIAEAGKGMYYFIETEDQIPLSFSDCLGGLQSVVAQNIHVEIQALDDVQLTRVLNSDLKTSKPLPCSLFSIDLGDMYSEEERDVLMEVHLPKLTEAVSVSSPIVSFTVSFFNVLSLQDQSISAQLMISRPAEVLDETRDLRVETQINRITVTEAMEQGKRFADMGDFEQARQHLRSAEEKIQTSAVSEGAYSRGLMQEMKECSSDMTSSRWQGAGRNKMMQKQQMHVRQRCNDVSSETPMYENKMKSAKKSMW